MARSLAILVRTIRHHRKPRELIADLCCLTSNPLGRPHLFSRTKCYETSYRCALDASTTTVGWPTANGRTAMSATVRPKPVCAAIEQIDQCVASVGLVRNVRSITARNLIVVDGSRDRPD